MTTTYEGPKPWTPLDRRLDDLLGLVDIKFEGVWKIRLRIDPGGTRIIDVGHVRRDIVTGIDGWGWSGKYRVSKHATDSEIVQAVFGLYKGYLEHEARETFEWRGRRVFGPHMDVRALWEVAETFDARKPPAAEVDLDRARQARREAAALDRLEGR
jgi:hypothetical protein